MLALDNVTLAFVVDDQVHAAIGVRATDPAHFVAEGLIVNRDEFLELKPIEGTDGFVKSEPVTQRSR